MNRSSIIRATYTPSADLPVNTNWRAGAACKGEDPELFFPIGSTGTALSQTEQAKAVCNRCLVMERCLQWALESGEDSGVWGGLSEDERRAMKRRAARRRARTASVTAA
ncbi:WhiB family transcriptional regulator [Streptomyces sp. NPDC014894]|uniref:WhiB family transcriptional regulator n=1 Tax=Streptomyces sp. NPDC014894 TaxID=3364931 RepID=UPI0036FD060B